MLIRETIFSFDQVVFERVMSNLRIVFKVHFLENICPVNADCLNAEVKFQGD